MLAATVAAVAVACDRHSAAEQTSATPAAQRLGPMLEPAELVKHLDDVKAGRTVVLHVGPSVLFQHAHVPGARALGEAGTDAGYQALVKAIAATPKDKQIVVYCGCCPYRNCPNVHPANKALHASGRKDFKLLDLPTNFRTDWEKKGYPVESS
jgi:hypothetical protein